MRREVDIRKRKGLLKKTAPFSFLRVNDNPHPPKRRKCAAPMLYAIGTMLRYFSALIYYPIQLFVLEYGLNIICFHQLVFTNFIGVDLSEGIDVEVIDVLERFQIREGTRLIVGIPNVAGDDGVARPGREGGASQISGVVAEPSHVPAVAGLRHADDGHLYAQRGDFEGHLGCAVGFGFGLRRETGDLPHWEAGIRHT